MAAPHSTINWLDTDGNVGFNLYRPEEITLQVKNLLAQDSVVEVLVSTIPVGSNVCYESKFSRDPVLGAMFPVMYAGGWFRDFYTFPAKLF